MSDTVAPLPTVLVADDEVDLVDLVARRLGRAGFTVITARNGEEAFRLAHDLLPDLVVLDVMMPRLTGLEVSLLLRAAPRTHAVPVILMSAAHADRPIIPDEADAFIGKPFGALALPALAREVLARAPRAPLRPALG